MSEEAFINQQDILHDLLDQTIEWRQRAMMLSHVCTVIYRETGISEDALRDQIGMDAADASLDPEKLPKNVREQMGEILQSFRKGKKLVTI